MREAIVVVGVIVVFLGLYATAMMGLFKIIVTVINILSGGS
jgi:hypothetical protein